MRALSLARDSSQPCAIFAQAKFERLRKEGGELLSPDSNGSPPRTASYAGYGSPTRRPER